METTILPMKIIDTNHYNKEIICIDVLVYPNIEDDDFSDIDPSKYEWEEREFTVPLFSNKKANEIFLTITVIDTNGFIMKVYENGDLLNKAKKAFDDFNIYKKTSFNKISDSDLFFDN